MTAAATGTGVTSGPDGLPWPTGDPDQLRLGAHQSDGLGVEVDRQRARLLASGRDVNPWSGVAHHAYVADLGQRADDAERVAASLRETAVALNSLAGVLQHAQETIQRLAAQLADAREQARRMAQRADTARAEAQAAQERAAATAPVSGGMDPAAQDAQSAADSARRAEAEAADARAQADEVEQRTHAQARQMIEDVQRQDRRSASAIAPPTIAEPAHAIIEHGYRSARTFVDTAIDTGVTIAEPEGYDVLVAATSATLRATKRIVEYTARGMRGASKVFGSGQRLLGWTGNSRPMRWAGASDELLALSDDAAAWSSKTSAWASGLDDIATKVGHAGIVVSIVAAGGGQLLHDLRRHPRMDTEELAGRAIAQGLTVGGGSVAVAALVVGCVVGLPITVSATGLAVIGFGISYLAAQGIDYVNDPVVKFAGDFADDPTEATKDLAQGIRNTITQGVNASTDVAQDVGETVAQGVDASTDMASNFGDTVRKSVNGKSDVVDKFSEIIPW